MKYKETLSVPLILAAGTLRAQQPTVEQVKVTPVLTKALPEIETCKIPGVLV
jgi:hypothetical protein